MINQQTLSAMRMPTLFSRQQLTNEVKEMDFYITPLLLKIEDAALGYHVEEYIKKKQGIFELVVTASRDTIKAWEIPSLEYDLDTQNYTGSLTENFFAKRKNEWLSKILLHKALMIAQILNNPAKAYTPVPN